MMERGVFTEPLCTSLKAIRDVFSGESSVPAAAAPLGRLGDDCSVPGSRSSQPTQLNRLDGRLD